MLPLTKYFATLFFLVYFLIAFVWPSVRTYRQTGVYPVAFRASDSVHDFVGKCFRLLTVSIPFLIAAAWTGDGLYTYLLPAPFLTSPAVQGCGMVLCSLSLVWTTVAQWQMGDSWRIGIDEIHRTELRTTGLFARSRNPVFLGFLVALLGFFLLLPNALTFVCLVAGYVLIQVAIRLEEAFLLQQHGTLYERYRASVRRFL